MTRLTGLQGKTMKLREFLNRTGEGKSAVVGWGRGMGHKGHMMLASSVITQADETGADPYFVLSRSVGKDDPLHPEEKLNIYRKVFPKHGQIFHVATEEMPDLTRVLRKLNEMGYTECTVVVGADQVKALSYVKHYNGIANKQGEIPFTFDRLDVIARQETNDPSRGEEGPRATPMRDILKDPSASEEQRFQAWRDAMSPELSDDEVRELMHKAGERMADPAFGKKPKKEKVAAEGMMDLLSKSKTSVKKKVASAEEMRKYFEKEKAKEPPKHKEPGDDKNVQAVHTRHAYENSVKYANKVIREMRAQEFTRKKLAEGDVPYAGKGAEKLHHTHIQALKNAMSIPNISMNKANGSPYMQYRFGMAMANPDMPRAGAMSGDPLITAYTDAELKKVEDAAKSLGAGAITHLTDEFSNEPDGTNTVSPVAKPKTNRYGI